MSDKSKIEWTDASWTPIRARNKATGKVGWHCEHDTTGCINCYAEGMNLRLGTGLPFKPGHRKDIEIFLDEDMLLAPLRWKRPRMVFVCSMTDLFADFVTDEMIDRMFAVMALCPQHTFQVLTKRSARMREYVTKRKADHDAGSRAFALTLEDWVRREEAPHSHPLPNVWLGVSAERQVEWDERVEDLGATPAAVRFVSAEPLLGPIDAGNAFDPTVAGSYHPVDWVIVGGESGHGARPMHPDWARSIRDQCQAAGVAFFFKQHGQWLVGEETDDGVFGTKIHFQDGDDFLIVSDGHDIVLGAAEDEKSGPRRIWGRYGGWQGHLIKYVAKKAAGRMLDGREWNEMPSARSELVDA